MASASQRSISTIRHAPVTLITAPSGPWTSTRRGGPFPSSSSSGAKTTWYAVRNRPRARLRRVLRLWTDRLVPKTVRMHQGSETTVAVALGWLRAEDEHVAGAAEAALGSLTWDQASR